MTGDIITAAWGNTYVRDNSQYLFDRDAVWCQNNIDLNIANNSEASLTFNTERFDIGGLHSTSSNTDRIILGKTARYRVGAGVLWDTNTTGRRDLLINLYDAGATLIGTLVKDTKLPVSGDFTGQVVSTMIDIQAGQFLRARVFQDSGGSLAVKSSSLASPVFWVIQADN